MGPTTESPPTRVFCFLTSSGERFEIEADTLCDQLASGQGFTLRRGGVVVGAIRDSDIVAWWLEESSPAAKAYCVRLNPGLVKIRADKFSAEEFGNTCKQVFTREGQTVGVIYGLSQPFSWWTEIG